MHSVVSLQWHPVCRVRACQGMSILCVVDLFIVFFHLLRVWAELSLPTHALGCIQRALKDKNTGELSNMNALVAGGVGGCCGQLSRHNLVTFSFFSSHPFVLDMLDGLTASSMTYPLDVIKTRLTVQHVEGKVGAIDMGRQIYRIEGVRGLYRGLVTTVIGIFPFAGMTFMAYNVR